MEYNETVRHRQILSEIRKLPLNDAAVDRLASECEQILTTDEYVAPSYSYKYLKRTADEKYENEARLNKSLEKQRKLQRQLECERSKLEKLINSPTPADEKWNRQQKIQKLHNAYYRNRKATTGHLREETAAEKEYLRNLRADELAQCIAQNRLEQETFLHQRDELRDHFYYENAELADYVRYEREAGKLRGQAHLFDKLAEQKYERQLENQKLLGEVYLTEARINIDKHLIDGAEEETAYGRLEKENLENEIAYYETSHARSKYRMPRASVTSLTERTNRAMRNEPLEYSDEEDSYHEDSYNKIKRIIGKSSIPEDSVHMHARELRGYQYVKSEYGNDHRTSMKSIKTPSSAKQRKQQKQKVAYQPPSINKSEIKVSHNSVPYHNETRADSVMVGKRDGKQKKESRGKHHFQTPKYDISSISRIAASKDNAAVMDAELVRYQKSLRKMYDSEYEDSDDDDSLFDRSALDSEIPSHHTGVTSSASNKYPAKRKELSSASALKTAPHLPMPYYLEKDTLVLE